LTSKKKQYRIQPQSEFHRVTQPANGMTDIGGTMGILEKAKTI